MSHEEATTLESLRQIRDAQRLIEIYVESIREYVTKNEYYEKISKALNEQFAKTSPAFRNVSFCIEIKEKSKWNICMESSSVRFQASIL